MKFHHNNYQDFFKSNGNYRIKLIFYEGADNITVEEFYNHVKERLKAETEIFNSKITDINELPRIF